MASKYDDGDVGGRFEGKAGDDVDAKGGEDGKVPDREEDPRAISLPPLVKKFAHFVISKKFRDPVRAWIQANCDVSGLHTSGELQPSHDIDQDFRDADLEAEQRIEWTTSFEEYIRVVEGLLDDFCAKQNLDAEDVFREVHMVTRSGELDEEFLPGILHVADYEYFLKQMAYHADKNRLLREAQDQASESKGDSDSISGIWKVDKKRTNFKTVDAYLAAVRVPQMFAGVAKGLAMSSLEMGHRTVDPMTVVPSLFQGSFFSNKEVIITQTRDSCTIIQESPFGMKKETFDLDGRSKMVRNLWNRETPVRAEETRRGALLIVYEEPPQLPRGSTILYRWAAEDDGRNLICSAEVDVPREDLVVQEIWYQRA